MSTELLNRNDVALVALFGNLLGPPRITYESDSTPRVNTL